MNANNNCRLCGGPTSKLFSKTILGKYDVDYFECGDCGSLQTEEPYWLDEAYSKKKLSNIDTGAAQRTLGNLGACFAVAKVFHAKNAIDVGGGDGLLCRLLRDYGINCYLRDKYASPTYAQGFTEPDFETPDLVTGFEVLEHLPNPSADLSDLFAYSPNVFLLSTMIYSRERSDWWYLSPESGQHVFFYSDKALKLIGKKYRYSLTMSGGFILFVRNASVIQMKLAKILLKYSRIIKSFVVQLPAPGVWRDHMQQVQEPKQPPL